MLVATEHRRNAPKRGGVAGPKVDSAFAESSVAGFAMDVALCVLFCSWLYYFHSVCNADIRRPFQCNHMLLLSNSVWLLKFLP